jgi:hypothetical protein
MALTSFALGSKSFAAAKFHSNDWNSTNTGTALGTGDGFEMLPSGAPRTTIVWADNESLPGGAALMHPRVKRQEMVEGSFTINAIFTHGLRPIASWWGAEAVAAGGGTGYVHTFTLSPSSTYVYNLLWSDNLVAHDIPMCKTESLSFNWDDANLGTVEIGVIGKRELIDDSGATTLANAEANITIPSVIEHVVISDAQCVVRINNQTAGALGTTSSWGTADVICPNAISLDFVRSYKRRFTSCAAPYMNEPVGTDWIDISGSITLPIWTVTQIMADIVAGTPQKMDIVFTGAAIGGGDFYEWKFEFPYVTIDSDGLPDLATADLSEITIPFVAHTAFANPTGMAFALPQLTVTDATAAVHVTNGV